MTEAIAFQRPHSVFPARHPKTTPSSHEDLKKWIKVHPLRRIHPSKLSPLTPPYQGHHPSAVLPRHQVPPPGLPFTLLLGAPFFRVPPKSLPMLVSPGVQVTSLNLKGLSRARVRCTSTSLPMYPCPLLPWAFRIPVHRHP